MENIKAFLVLALAHSKQWTMWDFCSPAPFTSLEASLQLCLSLLGKKPYTALSPHTSHHECPPPIPSLPAMAAVNSFYSSTAMEQMWCVLDCGMSYPCLAVVYHPPPKKNTTHWSACCLPIRQQYSASGLLYCMCHLLPLWLWAVTSA